MERVVSFPVFLTFYNAMRIHHVLSPQGKENQEQIEERRRESGEETTRQQSFLSFCFVTKHLLLAVQLLLLLLPTWFSARSPPALLSFSFSLRARGRRRENSGGKEVFLTTLLEEGGLRGSSLPLLLFPKSEFLYNHPLS